jgi:hypothetical protein
MKRWLFLCLFLAGCNQKLVLFLNDQADFSSYNSYAIYNLKAGSDQAAKTELFNRLENEIHRQMGVRNYQKSTQNPDVVMRYELIASRESSTQVDNFGFRFQRVTVRTFNQAILLFELKERGSNLLVWQASIDMNDHQRLSKKNDPIRAAVETLFNTYPYRAGSDQKDLTLSN